MAMDLWSAPVPAPAVRVSGQGRPTRGVHALKDGYESGPPQGAWAGMMNHVAGHHAQLRAQFITGFRV